MNATFILILVMLSIIIIAAIIVHNSSTTYEKYNHDDSSPPPETSPNAAEIARMMEGEYNRGLENGCIAAEKGFKKELINFLKSQIELLQDSDEHTNAETSPPI